MKNNTARVRRPPNTAILGTKSLIRTNTAIVGGGFLDEKQQDFVGGIYPLNDTYIKTTRHFGKAAFCGLCNLSEVKKTPNWGVTKG